MRPFDIDRVDMQCEAEMVAVLQRIWSRQCLARLSPAIGAESNSQCELCSLHVLLISSQFKFTTKTLVISKSFLRTGQSSENECYAVRIVGLFQSNFINRSVKFYFDLFLV